MKIRHKNEQRVVTPKFNSNNIDKKKEAEKQTVFQLAGQHVGSNATMTPVKAAKMSVFEDQEFSSANY